MKISKSCFETVANVLTVIALGCLVLSKWDDIADGFACLMCTVKRKLKVLQSAPRCRTCEDAEDWEK